ncbi:MAG TPA: glycerol-3-phosphate 1-O-acyltransferase PlsY [Candidatus Methylomirabilis sp.]|nr:glycerol-3-phosphate 1-O-acyltransferase PlsY [Candidatus Methylomirabilis sp.]
MIRDAALLLGAYLLGSVPFGLLIARLQAGVDLRRVGSGNIGATNVLRAVGKGAAALTLLGDIGKGALAVGIGRMLGVSATLLALIALSAVVGHLLPVFLGFRGGKGVATALGVVLAAMPVVGGLLVLIWVTVAAIWRFSSLAALAAAAALPVLAWVLDGRPVMVALGWALLFLVVLRHRENIARLWRGTEGRIGEKVRAAGG